MTTLFDLASRLVGEIHELPGAAQHPFIQWAHLLSGLDADTPDEVPWCSSGLNAFCFLWSLTNVRRLPRTKSAMARSWLHVGQVIDLAQARPGFDVVILSRGAPPAGHVGLFASQVAGEVSILGCNQSNGITIEAFPVGRVIGIRRLLTP